MSRQSEPRLRRSHSRVVVGVASGVAALPVGDGVASGVVGLGVSVVVGEVVVSVGSAVAVSVSVSLGVGRDARSW